MDLAAELRDYVTGRRDSKRERALLRRVLALPQAQRAEILLPLLDLNAPVALLLVNRAQLSRASYLTVLKQGLIKGDASSVRMWMRATVAHLGWRRVFSVLREALAAGSPGRGASVLYHVPSICGLRLGLSSMDAQRLRKEGILPKPTLTGPLPTAALAREFLKLAVLYQESGYTVVDERTFKRFKDALWDDNFHSHDSADAVSVEFELCWEDWIESRNLHGADAKTLKQYKADYLRFGAEHRTFSANEYGWKYSDRSGTERHIWSDFLGVDYRQRVIILKTPFHYPLPRSAFSDAQLASLKRRFDSATGESKA